MIITGNSFTLGWDAPVGGDQVDHTTIYEHVGTNYNVVQTIAQPANQVLFTNVPVGQHNYVAKFHNAAGDSASYSDELQILVLALPATVTNLTIIS